MDSEHRDTALRSCRALIRPICSLLLKWGVTWREFAEVAKGAFVEAATADYGIRGRPTNASRVAILTGLSRREVARQRELAATATPAAPDRTSDATRLLSGWHQDPEFASADGHPRELVVDGPGPSFRELFRRYGGDVPASAMLKELRRVGAVEEAAAGRLRALRRYYMPTPLDPQWILNAGSVLGDLGANINRNAVADTGHPSSFLGRASSDRVAASALPEFREFIEAEGEAFLERVDAWLTEHGQPEQASSPAVRLGMGLFMIEG